ncbi:hypothetical protein HJC06_13895 [Rhizobium sp. NLR9b]|uniref:hypothetical protein n=1 Tax=unclassified Rhizobium TaxID=2613769 RepID=UPI001C82B834|nr:MULTISPECIES: hypothetical protein [unclassified Rhizobium]MBX5227506.1 hypothetical protein [Rhizobium sp. NLR9b]MBX5288550.1 hypothetical protein [Rhizobium sp. NLR10b]
MPIVAAVVALAYAYAAVVSANNQGDYLASVELIRTQLAEISRKLDEIKTQLDDIQNEIRLLPLRIRGQIDDALAQDALAIANSICQRLSDYMRPSLIQQSIPAMRLDLNSLQDQIWRVKGAKGMAGLLLTSPLLATWLSGRVTLEKAALVYETGHVLDSPWTQAFMLDARKEYDEAFARLQDVEDFYNNWISPHSPRIDVRQTIVQSGTDRYFQAKRNGEYRVHDMFSQQLQRGDPLGLYWFDIDVDSPGQFWEAAEAYKLNRTNREEYQQFSPLYYQLNTRKPEIFDTFVEPADFWS